MKVKLGNKLLNVKDCKGVSSIKGLMFHSMDNIDGALIYANSIWMPFVKHELDLIFLDQKFRIIENQRAIPMTINPKTWNIYKNEKAKYCLELKKGITNPKAGMQIKIL